MDRPSQPERWIFAALRLPRTTEPAMQNWKSVLLTLSAMGLTACASNPTATDSEILAPPEVESSDLTEALAGLEMTEVTNERPVAFAALSVPETVRPGQVVSFAIQMDIAPTWKLYAKLPPGALYVPMKLEWDLPEGVEPVGDWDTPKKHSSPPDLRVRLYKGMQNVFVHDLRIAETLTGEVNLAVNLRYQACDPRMCLPPMSERLEATVLVSE